MKITIQIIGEDDLTPPRPKSEFPVVNSWDSFEIDDIDIIKVFNSLRNSNLPRKNPESAILGILGLTRQHKLTKNKLITIWSDLLNDFQLDVVWNMIELDRSEIEVFDNMKVMIDLPNASYIILSAHLKILKSSLDPYQDKFRKYWSEQQLTASRERRKEANKERARIGQKTDIIIELLTGPALICEVSGGLPAGCPKKIWTDKVDVIVFGCQVIGLQLNLYAMDTRTTGIYRFGGAHHVYTFSRAPIEQKLTDYCTKLKVE
ncbi:hypothetical protein GLOIN_2v1780589 [Rhizophagus irregularis DAOM 181602=DAOM 197198]|nr:hypothetical protein GLOIN_2v1780589 [Rhizophagus irregularis DAOM 181602=DAOM 197198]